MPYGFFSTALSTERRRVTVVGHPPRNKAKTRAQRQARRKHRR